MAKKNTPFDIAIIGLACRFPGADNPEAFWSLLENGEDAITEIPSNRFDVDAFYDADPDKPGSITTRYGGFLSQVDNFDPAFFGIPPRAADAIDPQQRLALEVSWEALENAAIAPKSIQNEEVGVFVGVSENDYARIAYQAPEQIDLYSGTGNLQAFVAGRIAYVLGVQGQAQSINTACSSSLVAVHNACQALRLEECELALAGGVHVILSPHNYIFLSRAKALSPDGRCKAFDANANGFARGEGCGMVVLKRLSHARRDKDNILGIIRGSAVNNDGPSGGLTVPNIGAQERLIRTALKRAALHPQQVSYLEAHGTGTILGDPIELQAAGKVYGLDRDPSHPLHIGSVKSNIGHSEAAAGIAGLIKVILAMGHGRIPKHLHFKTPNPRIPWAKLPFRVVTETTDWSVGSRIAGISSFGMSGTNAHLLVESCGETPRLVKKSSQRSVHILPLSAKTRPALESLISSYGDWLKRNPDIPLEDICFTAATGRDHFAHRAAIVLETREQLTQSLSSLEQTSAKAQSGQTTCCGQAKKVPGLVMLFTGQGSQYTGMARGLYGNQAVFRKVLDRCASILKPLLDIPLQPLLFDSAHGETLNQTRYTQPALFSLEVALYEWWLFMGIEPDVVMGHSLGEYVAAYAAGVFQLEDALRLVTERARLMDELPSGGAMAAVFAPSKDVEVAIAGTGLSIAAWNGVHQVISGPEAEVEDIVGKFEREDVRIQRLLTSQAFHSAMLNPMLEEFASFAETLNFQPPRLTLMSNLTGHAFASGEVPDSTYWCRHSREPVQFAKNCEAVAQQGGNILLEIGPHPVLTAMALHSWPDKESPAVAGSLHRKIEDNLQLSKALAHLYVAGAEPDWNKWDAPWSRNKVSLPTYPFQRRRCWVEMVETEGFPQAVKQVKKADAGSQSSETVPEEPRIHQLHTLPLNERRSLFIHQLQQALLDVLGLDDLPDPEANFFDMGLDSLMAVELRNRIQNLLGLKKGVSSAFVFEHPTLARLADQLSIKFDGKGVPEKNDVSPLSVGQQALWFIYQRAPESSAYNIGLLLRFESELDTDVLKRALRRLTARHTMLQSRLYEKDGIPCQCFDPKQEPAFRLWDTVDWNQGNVMDQVRNISQQPFVLEECVFRVDSFLDTQQGTLLLLGLHHIAGDARSMAILGQELCLFYSAEARGEKAVLPPLTSGYADFVQWEKNLLAGSSKENMSSYYLEQLAGGISVLQLPTDRPRPRVQTFNGASLSFSLSPELTQKLREVARQEQVTLFSVLFTAFQILLHRYTRQEEILLGVPTSIVRSRPEFSDVVGYLVNPMVVRGSFAEGDRISFCEKMVLNQHQILTGLDHQPYPFPLLMEQLQPARHPSYPPLVQALFAYETRGLIPKRFSAEGIKAQRVALAQMEGQFDVSMTFDDDDHTLSGLLNYNSDLFLPETAQRMSEHFQVLLAGFASNPAQDIYTQPMLTKAETHRLIDWNKTDRDFSTVKSIVDLFERQVEKTPSAIALVFEEGRLTYNQLNERANQLAHHLLNFFNRTQSGTCNPLIAIAVERSAELIICLLGILKAGGAYLPIDPAYPVERMQYMLKDSGAPLLLTQSRFKKDIPIDSAAHEVICLDETSFQLQPTTNPTVNRSITDLAYVIYTSGSTGKPKGVMIEHRGLVNLAFSQINTFQLLPKSRVLQFASSSFDASVSEITTTLLSGATLYLPSKYELLDPTEFTASVAEEKITHVTLPPSFLSNLTVKALSNLKTLVVAGEACPAELIEQWAGEVHFINAYGPTENTVCASMAVCSPGLDASPHIGRPIPNIRIYILDSRLHPTPPGVPGELCIAGAGLARGYLNRPGLTAEKFVELELLGRKERIYRTGDLARLLPDGNLDYLGRMDHQVKVRGFRIELGEIEAVLCKHPSVKDAVVTVYEVIGDKRLAAYLASISESKLKPAELREHLKLHLPEYMVPNHFIMLDRFPLTASGKIDRKALPEPEVEITSKEKQTATGTEKRLIEIWSMLFKGTTIHRHDNFFELGGHSLTAIQLIARIRDDFQVELPVRAVFEHPRLTDLAAAIETATSTVVLPPITKQPDDSVHIISFAQQRLWFLNRLEGNNSAVYNMPTALRLSGRLNIDALQKGLQWLVCRHDTLRSSFPEREGDTTVQVQKPSQRDILCIHDLTQRGSADQDEDIRNRMGRHSVQSFDLNQGPLFKTDLLVLDKSESVLLLNMHHIISDAWSIGVLIRDLQHAYIAFSQDREPDLKPLTVQYGDYAAWQQNWLQDDLLHQQQNYWQQQLVDAPELLELPIDKPRPVRQSHRGARYFYRLSPTLTRDLNDLSRSLNVSLFMTMLSTFFILLSRYCRVEDLCVGTPIVNRTHSETHDVIGLFVNTLVLRGRLKPNQSVTELLMETRKTCLAAYAHQDLPFEMLVEQLQPTRSLSHSPLFQVMFGLQNNDPVLLQLPDIKSTVMDVEFPISKFDLNLNVEEQDGELHCWWEYATDLFHAATIQRMAVHFDQLLTSIVNNPALAVKDLPMFTFGETETWLTLNDTATDYPDDKNIVALFENQAKKMPETIAVVFNGRGLTYLQLNEKANQLAHYLLQLKQEIQMPDDPIIAIAMERSLENIVGLLGILKAGLAYVPIDPDFPENRIQFMLQDCAAPLLLTKSHIKGQLPLKGMDPGCIPVYLDKIDFAGLPLANPNIELRATDLAYINYTSGSTGRPKGVSIPHRAVVRLVKNSNCAQLDSKQIFLQNASISFDAAVLEIWGALLNGARLVIMPPKQKNDLAALATVLKQEEITILWLATSLFNIMLEEHPTALYGVQQLLIGGEALSVSHVERALQLLPHTRLINGYGPTENTTFTCCYTITDQAYGNSIPIGRPIANTEVFIVDVNLQVVPIGVPGELVTAGAGLAIGYLNRPDLTQKKFIETEFFGKIRRIYRTGDLARLLPCGDIEFLGRIDHQVKLRGFRIELGEIETVLGQLSLIKEAIVTLYDADADKRLVAYLTPAKSTDVHLPIDSANLRDLLKKKLPGYMIPNHFITLENFPLTPSGKIDRKALSLLRPETAAGETPVTPTESILAGLWGTILHHDNIHRHDNFFNLGGHSLSATRLIARIRDYFQVELQVSAVFEHPRLDEQARAIEAASGAACLPTIHKQPEDAFPVLSFAQQRLWFLNHLENEHASVYNMPTGLELLGHLNVDALERSLCWLVGRHDSLRSVFPTKDGQATVQIYSPTEKEILAIHDLTGLPPEDWNEEIRSRAESHACFFFDLNHGPLFRCDLLRLSEKKSVLLLNMHHIISDGWSMGVFIQNWQHAYIAFTQGGEPDLGSLSIQYSDYAAWQQSWLQGEVLQRQVDYWHRTLAGAPELLELPLDKTRPPQKSYRGAHYHCCLPPELTKNITALGHELNVSLFMTLLTGFYILLSRYSRMDDLCVGTPIANRTCSSTHDLIGFFVNTLVLRGKLQPEQSVADMLMETRKTCLAAYAHQDIPFEMLVERLQPTRSLSHSPLVQVMFGLQNNDSISLDLPDLEVKALLVDYPVAKFDLSLNIEELNGELHCCWEFATDLFHASTIEEMANHYEKLLQAIMDDPGQSVSNLPPTLNSKPELNELPAADSSDRTDKYEAPSTPTEEVVAIIWTEILGGVRVGRHDNFFMLGGHSLLVVQLVNRLQNLFDVRVAVRELFEAPTVAGITQKLIDHEPQKGHVDTIARLQIEIERMSEEEIRAYLEET